jgi:alpha-1,2-mannosyltransferase
MRVPRLIADREPLFRRIVTALGIVVLLGCAARAMIKYDEGDFKLHWETGRRFLAKEFLYTGGHDFPYPPFFGMIFAPTALLPMPIAKAVFYPVAVAALLALLWTMRRLVRSAFSLDETQAFWVTAIAVFFAIQFLIHDQAILGLNTALVALTWLAIYLWKQRRDLLAGVSLGAAIAIKCTPAIFLGYFLWKRQWRMAISTTAATLFFTAAPMVWQGPVSWTMHMRNWVGTAIEGVSGSGFEANEDFRDKNMSLRPVLTRYLVRQPEGNFDPNFDPPPLDFLDLSPRVASWIVNSVLLILLAVFLWWSRGTVGARDEPRLLWELAAVGVLMVLFSPITWGQHCVALLPACYLIAALLLVRDRLPRWVIALLSVYILFCSLAGRDLIGRRLSLLLVSYHVTTFCILGLFVILLAGPRLQTKREQTMNPRR